MALIVRIDVDRPYGRQPLTRHFMSRISSDFFLPRLPGCGYLRELVVMLEMLNKRKARAHAFFRRCTIPSEKISCLMNEGGHQAGLHLENSQSFETFSAELALMEKKTGSRLRTFSKHGSGGHKYGWHHHHLYEPDRYLPWAREAGMKAFFGNLEDPTVSSIDEPTGLHFFPSAFWLETPWRDTARFTVDWLLQHAMQKDIVLLVHPENVLADSALTSDFDRIISEVPTRIIE